MTSILPLPFSNRLSRCPKSDVEGEMLALNGGNVDVVVPFSEKAFRLIY